MSEPCVEQMEIQPPTFNNFIKEVQKHGNIFTLNELYAHDQKHSNGIIVGVVHRMSNVIKNCDRQLLVIYLREVTVNCHKGKLFNLYAFNTFATSLADAHLQKGDFVAFCSAYIEENTRYHIENECHDLQARIGIPSLPGSKIFFIRKSQITKSGTSQRCSLIRCISPVACLEKLSGTCREPPASTLDRQPSPSLLDTPCNSGRISPLSCISDKSEVNCSTSTRILSPSRPLRTCSPVHSTSSPVSSSFSTFRVQQTHNSMGKNAIALHSTQIKYTYKKISELVEPERKVNVYGVISSITKMPTASIKHAIVRLKDETCGPTQEFRVHIFFKHEQSCPILEHGYIVRLHRMKTEVFDTVLDGRVFRASDAVSFPPEGQGLEGASSTAKSFHFCDSDAKRLTELRKWIASQNQQPAASTLPVSPVHSTARLSPQITDSASQQTTEMAYMHESVRPSLPTTEVADACQSVVNSEPAETLLSEINKEGSYVLLCKVLKVEVLSDEMLVLTVTDGTLCTFSLHFDQNSNSQEEAYASREVRILVDNPPLSLKKMKKGAYIELTDVKVQAISVPQFKRPILSFKMTGNNYSVKIYKGIEPKAVKLRRKLRAVQLKRQFCSESVELLTRKLATDSHRTQQKGGCACPLSSSSLSSSSHSESLHTDTEYDTEINCDGKSESKSSNSIEETEKSVSTPVSSVLRKRASSYEGVTFRSRHKSQKLMSEDLDPQRTVNIGIAGIQTNDIASPQTETIINGSDNSESLLSVSQSYSVSVSQDVGIQRRTVSEQTSSHPNDLKMANSKSLPVTSETDTNCTVTFKQLGRSDVLTGAHGSKSVPPMSVQKTNTSEHPIHSQELDTSLSSVTSIDQYMSAVSSPLHSSPVLQQCKTVNISESISENEHGSRIITSTQREGSMSLPSTSRQQISVHQTKDTVTKPRCNLQTVKCDMPVTQQKLQQNITSPILPSSTNADVFSKKHLSLCLDGSGGSDNVNVTQPPIRENDQSNPEDYAQVENTPPPLTSAAERDCQSLQRSVVEQSIANRPQFPVLDKNSELTDNSKHKGQYTENPTVSQRSMQQDLLAGNTAHEGMVDEVDERYSQFADAIKTRSGAQNYTSTQSSSSHDMYPVFNAEFCNDDEMNDEKSVSSDVISTSEVDDLDSSYKFSALRQASLTDIVLSNNPVAETLVFADDTDSSISSLVTNIDASVSGTVKRGRVFEKRKSRSKLKDECIEQDNRRCNVPRGKCTNEHTHTELSSAELDSGTFEYKEMFASGINTTSRILPANISYIKRRRTGKNERLYLLKAWVKDIEPPIHSGSEMNIVSGFCECCHQIQSYEALVMRLGTNQPMCGYCFQAGKKKHLVLAFLLRLYLIDENNDELIVTVSAQRGIELLGCPVSAYLIDSVARRRVTQILTKLIEKNKNVPLQNRGPMLKLLIVPVRTSKGMEYLVHNIYL